MSVAVPFFDPWAAGLRTCWGDVLRAWKDVLERGRFLAGPEVAGFEAEWAARVGAAHCVAVSSGTDALALALRAVDAATVIVPAFTCPATVGAVVQAAAMPIAVEVDARTGLMSAEHAIAEMRRGGYESRVLMPVHLFGRLAPVEALAAAAADDGVPVIEDAAQAHGVPGVGRHSLAACWSFYPTKNLGAPGDAGAITTNDAAFAERCRRLRHYGAGPDWAIEEWGWVARMDEVQAAALRIRLRRLEAENRARAFTAAEYRLRLPPALDAGWATAPTNHHLFPVRVRNRLAFRAAMLAAGVETGVHYPHALGNYPNVLEPVRCKNATAWAREEVSLPCWPGMRGPQVDAVVAAVSAAMQA